MKQNFARKHKIPIDTITFSYTCLPPGDPGPKPEDGAFISGMYVEGARWCSDTMMLAESQPKVLYSAAPMMMLSPCEESKMTSFPHYECPLYRYVCVCVYVHVRACARARVLVVCTLELYAEGLG